MPAEKLSKDEAKKTHPKQLNVCWLLNPNFCYALKSNKQTFTSEKMHLLSPMVLFSGGSVFEIPSNGPESTKQSMGLKPCAVSGRYTPAQHRRAWSQSLSSFKSMSAVYNLLRTWPCRLLRETKILGQQIVLVWSKKRSFIDTIRMQSHKANILMLLQCLEARLL